MPNKPLQEQKTERGKEIHANNFERENAFPEEMEIPKEAATESREGVELPKKPLPEIMKGLSTKQESPPEMSYKTELQKNIEAMLSTPAMEGIYHSLPSKDEQIQPDGRATLIKEDFLAKGEEAAKKIEHLINTKKASDEEFKKIVLDWLTFLPYDKDDPFITQELLNITAELSEKYIEK